jgi:hypothetical protein
MKANKLRIGNWVNQVGFAVQDGYPKDHKKLHQIKEGKEIDFSSFMEPIKLTDDWLLKFGAKKHDVLTFYHDRFRLDWKEAYGYWYVMDLETLTYMTKVEFVHEYQNFFHVMNGQELTINEL